MTRIDFEEVNSIDELKNFCNDENYEDFFILLRAGLRSSKLIMYDKETDTFNILNSIDDSEQELTTDELYTDSNIGQAIENKCFFKYVYYHE